jgi:cell volume regulation protein A
MSEVTDFGLIVLVVAAVLAAAVLSNRLTERLHVPAPALFLIGAALLAKLFPDAADTLSIRDVERIAVVALIVILFDGGMRVGWGRFRESVVPIATLGLLGTFATAGLLAVAAHFLLDFEWKTASLIGAALAPTDPAVMFSVLGRREIAGRTSTILEGESGANDPVGIALMIAMVSIASADPDSTWSAVGEFFLELSVGTAIGVVGALSVVELLRRVHVPDESLYPLWTLAAAGVIYGVASVAHGSGFLAVFIAGILVGDRDVPAKRRIERFQTSLASLAEIVVFVALGLTVHVAPFDDGSIWTEGLVLAALLGLVVRPLAVWPLLLMARLTTSERMFVVWGGLKGAVPILLATLAVLGDVEQATRIYGIVFIVVAASVIVQGSTVPLAASRLRIPMRRVRAAEAA